MRSNMIIVAVTSLLAVASAYTYERLDRNKSMVLILDLQVGLFNIVRDIEPVAYKQSVISHAEIAKAFDLPVVMTTSAESGANGPLPGEIIDMFPDAPLIKRPGQVNAWDNEDVREAVANTNRTQIILAGIMTDVCTAFCALSLREAGYGVWANVEASGTVSELVRSTANDRMKDAGVQLVSFGAIFGELMRDWRTPPTGINPFIILDDAQPAIGMLARGHAAAIANGTVMPGQDELPVASR